MIDTDEKLRSAMLGVIALRSTMLEVIAKLPEDTLDALTVLGAVTSSIFATIEEGAAREILVDGYCQALRGELADSEDIGSMMSSSERAARRGAMAFLEFEAAMVRLGFIEEPPQGGMLHEYTHPDAPHRRFSMAPGERYSGALERLRGELETARGGPNAQPNR